jgi:hypothetical protein
MGSASKAFRDAFIASGDSVSDFQKHLAECMPEGAKERRPQPGLRYKAFAVHPSKPGPTTLVIGHREGEMRIIDLMREGLTIAQGAELAEAYGIDTIVDAVNDEDDALLHALAGVVNELQD